MPKGLENEPIDMTFYPAPTDVLLDVLRVMSTLLMLHRYASRVTV